jgi:predicted lipoprotein with Yx(FWY)xxD motif
MRSPKLILPVLLVIVGIALVAALAARSGSDSRSKAVVKTMKVGSRTLLVDRRGMTLYHLSVERRGHFICTDRTCLSLWKPLVVRRGVTPTGVKSLGTVKRPDGRLQVAYKGGPLYTFVEDRKPGDTKGDGFRDVGVWHPIVVVGKAPVSNTGSGGYGY